MLIANIPNNYYKKQINFGATRKPELVKKVTGFFIDNIDKILKKGINQTSSNIINYAGRALFPPLMILAGSKFTHEDEDSIKYSMLLSPLNACFSLITTLGVTLIGNKFVDKAAKRGFLGEFFRNNAQHLSELKNISALSMTFLAIPVTAKLLSWSLPKVMRKIDDDIPIPQNLNFNIYAQNLKPQFRHLTGENRKNV
ncbi:MAG: hypothetical protein A2Y25_07680 [Candidatus Melainabacteria bacterium GWF2_37_15]|nr:MAG: hypothetical protein A2Y25_07680 [Candidatus Melainabacteria bacterium GWF2_37_15]